MCQILTDVYQFPSHKGPRTSRKQVLTRSAEPVALHCSSSSVNSNLHSACACRSMVMSRVARIRVNRLNCGPSVRRSEPSRTQAFLASGPRAMAAPWDPRGGTFVASPCSRNVAPSFSRTSLPTFRLLEHYGKQPPLLETKGYLGLLARFFQITQVRRQNAGVLLVKLR